MKELEHPYTLRTMSQLACADQAAGKLDQAVALLRECLDLGQKNTPGDWATFAAQSNLGMALLAQKQFDDAEPLLLQGYAGLKEQEKKIPASSRSSLKEAGERLIQLYEAWDRPTQASEWRRKLEADGERKSQK